MSGTCSISMLVYWKVLLVWCVYCHSSPGELMDSDPQSRIAQARSPPLFILNKETLEKQRMKTHTCIYIYI